MPLAIPVWQAVILAIVQGITEFLPVSSTAHLILFPWLLGWTDPGLTFDVALHAGTLIAVIAFFFLTWIRIFRAGFGASINVHTGAPISGPAVGRQRRLLWFLVVATIPAAIIGYLFEAQAESTWRQPLVIACGLIGVGILMGIADRFPGGTDTAAPSAAGSGTVAVQTALAPRKDYDEVSFFDSLWIGCSQALAIIPGVSRSGITITWGLFQGLNREAAARFSFLLSTPIIAGAVLKKGLELRKHPLPPAMHAPFVAGVVVSAIVGVASIALFIRFLKLRTLRFFVWYRILLGIFVIAWFFRVGMAGLAH